MWGKQGNVSINLFTVMITDPRKKHIRDSFTWSIFNLHVGLQTKYTLTWGGGL